MFDQQAVQLPEVLTWQDVAYNTARTMYLIVSADWRLTAFIAVATVAAVLMKNAERKGDGTKAARNRR